MRPQRTRTRTRTRTAAVAVVTCGALYACTIVNGLEVPKRSDGGVAPPRDASPSADACVVPDAGPVRDSGTVVPGGPPIDGVYAVRKITFGTGTFDASNSSICPRISPTCRRPNGVQIQPATSECANSAGAAISLLSTSYSVESRYNYLTSAGKAGALFRIQRAVGTDRAGISFYPSPGREVCGKDVAPVWNGRDVWDIDAAALSDKASKISTYFTQTTLSPTAQSLTVQLPGLALRASSEFTLRLDNPTLTFRLVNGEPVEALVIGRWSAEDSYRAVRTLLIGDDKHPLCKDPILDPQARKFLCESRDITASGTPAGQNCDAISMAIDLELAPALLGDAQTLKVPPDPCADAPAPSPSCP